MNKKVYKNLHDAVGRILSVCDGASSKDGVGFAKTDVGFARSLFDQLEWTPRQARAIYKSLYKYKEQLLGFGIEYGDIKPIIEAEDEKDPIWTADLVEEDYILLSFNSSDKNLFYQTLDNIKDLPGRIYIAKDKKWKVPLSVFNINRIDKMGFSSDAGVKAWYEKNTNPENVKKKKSACDPKKIAGKINIPEMMPFQLEGVSFVEEKEHRALIGDDMGCIDGEAIISINRGGGTRKMTLESAYNKYNQCLENERHNWESSIPTKIRCLKNGRFGLHPLQDILYKGERFCKEITTESGKSIVLTFDHELLSPDGWFEAQTFKRGDSIFVNGTAVCQKCGSTEDIITYKYAKYKGYCKKCMYKKLRKNHNIFQSKKHLKKSDGYTYLRGQKYINHDRYSTSGLLEHIYVMEQYLQRPLTDDEEVHHKDGNRSNNKFLNLQLVTKSEHKKIHKTENHFKNYIHKNGSEVITIPKLEKITRIRNIGWRHVYDIVMEDPHRNFIANGIVVHNCGKTLQALAFLKLHPEMRPAVVVTTASMKTTWRREALKWIKEDCHIISGRNSANEYLNSELDIFIINYDIVKDHLDTLSGMGIKNITIDESHKIANPQTLRTVAVKKLCKGVPSIVGLTGTPFLNRPIEIFTIINILQPKIFPNYYRFGKKYCDAQHNGFGMEYKGVSNAEELHDLLKEHVMIRRMKTDVLKDLPEKTRSVIVFPITNRSVYEEADRDVISFIHEQDGLEAAKRASKAEVLARFNKLKLLATEGKLQACLLWIKDFLESGEKLIVFAINKVVVDAVMEEFGDIAVKIDGSVSQKNRTKAVDDFQTNDKIRLFVGNMPAASEGITLTAASNLAFLQLGWTPGIHSQSEDRPYRIGQKNACTIYYLISENTIEEKISLILDEKRKICEAVLDGKTTEQASLLSDMIENYKKLRKSFLF